MIFEPWFSYFPATSPPELPLKLAVQSQYACGKRVMRELAKS
jgi:hypothetical protein